MVVIDGNAKLRQPEYPCVTGIAGAYGIGSGHTIAGEGKQHAALDAEKPRGGIRRNKPFWLDVFLVHVSPPAPLEQHLARSACAFLPIRHDLALAEVRNAEPGNGAAIA
jgi:hypothetical protein